MNQGQILTETMTAEKAPIDFAALPAWARWIAQDANGTWWTYEHAPNEGATSWYENEVGASLRLEQTAPADNWRDTLRKIR